MNAEQPHLDRIPYAELTFGLPAQRFGITCAISLEETLPVVNEFAIRMIQTCGSLRPAQLQSFFGFSDRETTIVIRGLLEEKLIRWEDEQLALTSYALSKFVESYDGIPRCVRVKEWSGDVTFELLTFSPLDRRVTPTTLRSHIELSGSDVDREARTAYWAERSFQEHFYNIVPQQGRMQIYKISEIEPKERFIAPLQCTFLVSLDGKAEVTRSLPDRNLEDRAEVVQAISDALGRRPRRTNEGLPEALRLFGVWDTSAFAASGTLDVVRYLDLVHVIKANPFGCDVSPITGALYLSENRKLLKERLALLAELHGDGPARRTVYWLAPDVLFWGRSLATRSLIWDLKRIVRGAVGASAADVETEEDAAWPEVRTFVQPGRITDRQSLRAYADAVPHGVGLTRAVLDGNVEVLWIPDVFVCVLYHYQTEHAIPLPLGFFSSAPAQLEAAKRLFVEDVLNQDDLVELKNADRNRASSVAAELASRRDELLGISPPSTSNPLQA